KGKKNSNTKVISNIPGQYLSVYDNTSGELVRFATIQPGREYPVIRQTGRWYEIDYAGRIGYIYEPATRITYNGGENYFKVLTEFLSIYDNSTGKLVKVGSLIENQEFP